MTERPEGVLPDEVIRDPKSDAELLFVTLRPDLERPALEGFLRGLSQALAGLTGGEGADQAASACVGLGKRFLDRAEAVPVGLTQLPAVTQGELLDVDIVIYVMCREEWRLADFRRGLASLGAGVITSVVVQRGFQRPDGRELGGFLDGLRNARDDRHAVVFVDRDREPSEPAAAEGGTYMVTMRIPQDLAAWAALTEADQEQVMGRRKSDGSRLDVPAGTTVDAEGEITAGCPLASHVAKAGPRGEHRDRVQIFRRGVPFIELRPDGVLDAGLQFVSFQASMEQFLTLSDEWMSNTDFPEPGTGVDALFARGFATVTHTGFFFVPAPAEFIGSQFLVAHPVEDRCLGRIAIRKKLVDSSGSPIRGERGGFSFQLLDQAGSPVGEPFTTDSTGRALSPAAPVGDTYTVREVTTRPGFDPAPDQAVVLDRRRIQIEVINKATVPNPGYGR